MVTAESFIRIWNQSATLAEAAHRCGIVPASASKRATRYRRRGIYMKRMGAPLDYKRLARLSHTYQEE